MRFTVACARCHGRSDSIVTRRSGGIPCSRRTRIAWQRPGLCLAAAQTPPQHHCPRPHPRRGSIWVRDAVDHGTQHRKHMRCHTGCLRRFIKHEDCDCPLLVPSVDAEAPRPRFSHHGLLPWSKPPHVRHGCARPCPDVALSHLTKDHRLLPSTCPACAHGRRRRSPWPGPCTHTLA